MHEPHELVALDADHPGFRDAAYRERRNEIARVAIDHRTGEPVPRIRYLPTEDALWAELWSTLQRLHVQLACRAALEAQDLLEFDGRRVPQLEDVNRRLRERCDFRMEPVAGLVSEAQFLRHLGAGVFLCTQYIRHTSRPRYTPEPDVVHELIGHAGTLAHPVLAAISGAFGRAAEAVPDECVGAIARLYWFTMEYGVVLEDGDPKALGAGLLSSVGEIQRMDETELLPLDADRAAHTAYDPTDYQPRLFVARSADDFSTQIHDWLDAYTRTHAVRVS